MARYVGVIGVLIPLGVSFYYVFIEAWTFGYFLKYLTGGVGVDASAPIAEQAAAAGAYYTKFTGAAQDRDGFFQAAHGGTLFLDEVAELPLHMQVLLLRAIQEKRVRKVGATEEQAVDVRIISATHQRLAALAESGRFRRDLFYRLNVIELAMPPLRVARHARPSLICARWGLSHRCSIRSRWRRQTW
jgi:hypothetical protein